MVDGHFGTVIDGVFTSRHDAGRAFAASSPVPIASLLRGTVVVITLTGKSRWFTVAIASTSALNYYVYRYNKNHHAAFHYSSVWGRVNRTNGTFAVHDVPGGGPFTTVLTLRGSDRTVSVSFSVNGVPQDGVWALPTTEFYYIMLATNSGGTIAVTDVSVATV